MDLTTRSQQAVSTAVRTAADKGNPAVEPAHLAAALLSDEQGLARPMVQAVGVDPANLSREFGALVSALPAAAGSTVSAPQPSRNLLNVLAAAERIAKDATDEYVSGEHLLIAPSEVPSEVASTLTRLGANPTALRAALTQVRGSTRVTSPDPEGTYQALEKYGVDLTAAAREGKLDPGIGRNSEIRRVIQVLSRRTKNNPVLIGEPGVGKTAVVEGLAQRIVA